MSQDNIPIIVKVSDDASNHVKDWFTQDEGSGIVVIPIERLTESIQVLGS